MIMILADIIVILGCGYIGMFMASKLDARISQLEEFEKTFTLLIFNIGYIALPIKDALSRITSSQRGVIKDILEQTSSYLQSYNDISFSDAWCQAIKLKHHELCLTTEEIEILFDFPKNIGNGDCTQSIDNIQLTIAKIKHAKENAIAEKMKNSKLYRGTGFLVGMLIVLLLL